MKNKLNILFLTSWYPTVVDTQNGNFIQQHARAVSKICNVYVLHVISRVQNKDFMIESELNKNVFETIVYYKKSTFSSLLGKKKHQKQAYLKGYLETLKQAKKIDLVHLNVIFPAGLFALYLKKKYKIPFIITEHWTGFLKIRPIKISKAERFFIKKVSKKASYICPVSKDLETALVDFGIRGIFEIIPNVVNSNFFFFKEKKETDKINILHVSSLKEEHKNSTGILNVVKNLSKVRSDFKLTIIGDGDIKPVIEYANKIQLSEDFLDVKSKQPLEIIAKEMQEHDVFLLFSNYENLPCVIAESLVSGLPVISSNVGGIREMIHDKNGILVKAKNEHIMLKKLNYLLDNLEKYDRKAIAQEAKEKYDYNTVAKQFLTIYKKTLKV